ERTPGAVPPSYARRSMRPAWPDTRPPAAHRTPAASATWFRVRTSASRGRPLHRQGCQITVARFRLLFAAAYTPASRSRVADAPPPRLGRPCLPLVPSVVEPRRQQGIDQQDGGEDYDPHNRGFASASDGGTDHDRRRHDRDHHGVSLSLAPL